MRRTVGVGEEKGGMVIEGRKEADKERGGGESSKGVRPKTTSLVCQDGRAPVT